MTIAATRLEAQLRALPDIAVSDDVARFEVDGVRPSLVVAPSSQQDVASVLAAATEAGAAVVPWGGGTHMALGTPPERYDLALDLRRLNRVIEYEPADMTVTVEAGITLSELQKRLGEHGQWLALDPPGDAAATIGGLLAANVSGPARHSRGTLRDLLIGVRFATADGLLINAGGRVVKNVAGYDLGKLQIGALGTLGVITQAAFKAAPLPAKSGLAEVRGNLSAVMSIAARLSDGGLAVEGLVLLHEASEQQWRLQARLSGGEASVERSQRELTSMAPAASYEADAAPGWPAIDLLLSAPVVAKASLPPTSVSTACEAFASAGAAVVAYPGVGIVYAAWQTEPSTPDLTALRKRCVDALGALVLERAPVELKRTLGVWGDPRGDFALMKQIKDELDPKRTLNPGRFVGGI